MPNKAQELFEDYWNRLPGSRPQRIKLVVAGGLTIVCVLWIAYFLIGSISWEGPTQAPNSSAHRLAKELNAKLIAQPEFNDVGLHVLTERPLKFQVSGAVHDSETMEALQKFLAEIRPQNDYELDVTIMPH